LGAILEESWVNQMKCWEEELEKCACKCTLPFDKWLETRLNDLPEHIQKEMFEKVDYVLFHMHSILQSSIFYSETRKRILSFARVISDQVQTITDLKKLPLEECYQLAEKEMAKQRLYSFIQGGIASSGGVFSLSADIVLQIIFHMRAVQTLSLAYGYEVSSPYEMMLSLKVFHSSLMPKHLKFEAWNQLKEELQNGDDAYFYEQNEPFVNHQTVNQILKCIAMQTFKYKTIRGKPILSLMIGGGIRYRSMKVAIEFAHKFYQYRHHYEGMSLR